jgi:hypothetical protein
MAVIKFNTLIPLKNKQLILINISKHEIRLDIVNIKENHMLNSPLGVILSSTVGILSLFTIGFVIAMAIYLYIYVQRHIKAELADENLINKQNKQ